MEEKLGAARPHRLTIQDRKLAGITGVSDCVSFDENEVVLDTDMGKGSPCEPAYPGKRGGGSGRDGGKLCLQLQRGPAPVRGIYFYPAL